MLPWRWVFLLLAVLLLSACQPLVLPETTETTSQPAALDPALVANIEAFIADEMAINDITGLAIGIVFDGQLAYANGFGAANLDTGAAVTPQTVFLLAETSMTPTAMAILQLVEQEKIDLDAPLTDYLPYFEMADERAQEITVGQILAHTSGIPDSGDTATNWALSTPEYDEEAIERMVRGLAERRLLIAPGQAWVYSDIAYMVLGDVIAKVAGQPFEEYMAEHIFAPLGMDGSTYLLNDVDPSLLAHPHTTSADGIGVSEVFPYSRQFAASNNLFSNVEDMSKFVAASLDHGKLQDTRVLSDESFGLMVDSPHRTPYGGIFSHWGMGWWITEIDDIPAWRMGGADLGFEADATLCPDENMAVIVMGNGAKSGGYYTPYISLDVMEMLLQSETEG